MRMPLWLTSGEDYPAYSQGIERLQLPAQLGNRNRLRFPNLPYVAHHTAAIASFMQRDHDHRHGRDLVRSESLRPYMHFLGDRYVDETVHFSTVAQNK